jgi:ribosomal protein L19E
LTRIKTIGIAEQYAFYLKNTKSKNKLSKDDFKNFVYTAHSKIADSIIGNGFVYKIPYNIGEVKIMVHERRALHIDWAKTKAYKKELIEKGVVIKSDTNPKGEEYFIYRTDPYYYGFKWNKGRKIFKNAYNLKNKSLYKFKVVKANRKKLSSSIDDLSMMKYGSG